MSTCLRNTTEVISLIEIRKLQRSIFNRAHGKHVRSCYDVDALRPLVRLTNRVCDCTFRARKEEIAKRPTGGLSGDWNGSASVETLPMCTIVIEGRKRYLDKKTTQTPYVQLSTQVRIHSTLNSRLLLPCTSDERVT